MHGGRVASMRAASSRVLITSSHASRVIAGGAPQTVFGTISFVSGRTAWQRRYSLVPTSLGSNVRHTSDALVSSLSVQTTERQSRETAMTASFFTSPLRYALRGNGIERW
ncbi:MAG: hypothetical protein ACXW4P_08155 [Thermoanaerobaculia bacterium]